jgi:hypothetical protein
VGNIGIVDNPLIEYGVLKGNEKGVTAGGGGLNSKREKMHTIINK